MRVRRRVGKTALVLVSIAAALLLSAGRGVAQVVEVTPAFEITPSTETTPWVIWFAYGAAGLGVLVLLGVGMGYMRFGPKFFGREAAAQPPGARPPQLVREAAAVRWTAPPPAAQATGSSAAPATASEPASEQTTAPPAGEQAVQADAVGQAEAEAPSTEAPVAEAPTETPVAPSTETPVAEAPTETPVAPSTETPVAEAPTEPAQAPAASPPPGPPASSALDQETFDRVLQEQLDKGVDRRVAEGRARAAAVVAARKKAQG